MSVETIVREHLRANDAAQEPIDWNEIVGRSKTGVAATAIHRPVPSRGVLVLAAAMVIVILIGVIPWFLRSAEEPPPATQPPPPPTTLVTSTTVPEATPTTVPETTPTTVPLPSGRQVALTEDELAMFGVLLEAAETLETAVRISVNGDGAEGANTLGAITFEDAGARIDVWRFDSEALATSFVEDWVGTLTASFSPNPLTLPAPQGWDQSAAIGETGGRFPSRVVYLVRNQGWVLMREVAGSDTGDLTGTQTLTDAVFGAVESGYAPTIDVYVDERRPPLPDSYVTGTEILAPLPGYGDGAGESEFQGLAWGTELTVNDSQPASCTTWHVPLGEVEPTVWDSYTTQGDQTIRWTTMGADFERTTSIIAGDDPAYLSALDECTRPVDAAGWGLRLPDGLPPGLEDLTPIPFGAGRYFAQDVLSDPHEIELDPGQVASLGWFAADIEVVSAMASLAPNGLTSIYVDLRGPTAALGRHFGVDLSELGPGPIDVAFSLETSDTTSPGS